MAKPGSQAARDIARRRRGSEPRAPWLDLLDKPGRRGSGPSARVRQVRPELAGADASGLTRLVSQFEQAASLTDALSVMREEYPGVLHEFRLQNWRALGLAPAPTPNGSIEEALDAGWFKMKLRDGTDGFLMRRTDDCSTATVATLAGVHPSLVPDPQEMERILSGIDPMEVMADQDRSYDFFAAQTGIRLRAHATPPTWSRRWIGVIERDPCNPLANHLLVMAGRDLLMDPAHIGMPMGDDEVALEGFTPADITLGYTLDG